VLRIRDGEKSESGTSKIIFPRAILKFFDADLDPGSGMEKFRSGIRHKEPGSGINIPDPQHCKK
jgi:hypothetical protein